MNPAYTNLPIYDTLHIQLSAEDVEGGFSPAVGERVADALERGYRKPKHYLGEDFYQGYLGNLRVTLYADRLTIKGSIWTYTKGNQLEPMSLAEVAMSFQHISDLLGLPLERASVKRLDMACNIETDFEPKAYYIYLGAAGRFIRQEQDNGLYYRKGNVQLHLYDKLRQMRRTTEPIPAAFARQRLLRYEIRFMKNVPKQFNMSSVTVATLLEEDFLYDVRQRWETAYYFIQKERKLVPLLAAVTGVKSFIHYLALLGIKYLGGTYRAAQLIKQGQLERRWDNQVASRLNKKLTEIAQDQDITCSSPLVDELDSKVAATNVPLSSAA